MVGIVDLEEQLENLPIADAGGVEDDLDGFGVSGMIAIGRVGVGAAGIADSGRQDAVVATKEILHAPETTAGENSAFRGHWILRWMKW